MNNDNLQKHLTASEAREKGSKGGKASVIARRRKKALRELAEIFGTLSVDSEAQEIMKALGITDEKLHTRDMQTIISLYGKAMKGDVAAFNALRDIKGEKPREELALDIPNTLRIEIVGDSDKEFPSSEDEIKE